MAKKHLLLNFYCIVFFFLLLPTAAHSELITFEFTGTVSTVYEAASSLPSLSSMNVGDPVTGHYVFESTTSGVPDIYYHLNHTIRYWNVLNQFEILFDESMFSLVMSSLGIITVQNNDATGALYKNDNYKVNTGANLVFASDRIKAEIILSDGVANAGDGTDPDGLPGSSSALPLTPPDLTLFDRTTRIDIFVSTSRALGVDLVSLTLPPNLSPIANAGQDQIIPGNSVLLDGSGSSDPDGSIVSWSWTLEHLENSAYDETTSGETPTVSNLEYGNYTVTLTVTDNRGDTGSDEMYLSVAASSGNYDQVDLDRARQEGYDEGYLEGMNEGLNNSGNTIAGIIEEGAEGEKIIEGPVIIKGILVIE